MALVKTMTKSKGKPVTRARLNRHKSKGSTAAVAVSTVRRPPPFYRSEPK
jgi:hypothetical protein